MARRAILRSNISFGLVSIPVELYSATHSDAVHFNLLHAKDNSRIQERIYCVREGKQVDRSELVHGFQISKGKYVSFFREGAETAGSICESTNRNRSVRADLGSRSSLLRRIVSARKRVRRRESLSFTTRCNGKKRPRCSCQIRDAWQGTSCAHSSLP